MSNIELSDADRQIAVEKIQRYINTELDREIGSFDAQFLPEFFAKEIGAIFYNQGMYDAQAAFKDKIDTHRTVFWIWKNRCDEATLSTLRLSE